MRLDHPKDIRPCLRLLDFISGYFYLDYNTFSTCQSLTQDYINFTSDVDNQLSFRFLLRYVQLVPQTSLTGGIWYIACNIPNAYLSSAS
jgi:hypothetical protein